MSDSRVIEFPQQRAWNDAQRLRDEEEKRKTARSQRRKVTISCCYKGGFADCYRHLLSDPPSIFAVTFHDSESGKRAHFIANLDRMPIADSKITVKSSRLRYDNLSIELED